MGAISNEVECISRIKLGEPLGGTDFILEMLGSEVDCEAIRMNT